MTNDSVERAVGAEDASKPGDVARVVLAAVVAVGLMGCDNIQQQFDTGMQFLRDEQTGCQYVKLAGSNYLTPRLGKDGKPMCGAT